MNFTGFNEKLKKDLTTAQSSIPNILKRAQHCITNCRNVLLIFKEEVLSSGFNSVDEEINFFKTQKVFPLSQLIHYSQIYSYTLDFPKGNHNMQSKFLNKEINKLSRFFKYHRSFHEYIESGYTHFDELYFNW